MVGDDQRYTVEAVHLAPEFSDRQLRLKESLGSERSESKDCFWTNELELAKEIRAAGGYFVRHRISVAWWPVLQNVANEYVVALQIHCGENLCEQLPRRAYERESLSSSVAPGASPTIMRSAFGFP